MKRLLILSTILSFCWSVGLAADEEAKDLSSPNAVNAQKIDSLFTTIGSFAVTPIHQDTSVKNTKSNNTLRYSSSKEGREVEVDSLSGSITPLSSGEDTVYVKSHTDTVARFVVAVAPIPKNMNVNVGQVDAPDKWEWIKDYSLISIAVILLTLLIMSYIKSGRRKRILDDLDEGYRDLKERNRNLERSIQDKDREYRRLFNENKELKREVQQRESHRIEVVPTIREEVVQSIPKSNKLYAASINDGYLSRITDAPTEDTIFELTKGDSRNATFTIYHGVQERVKARPTLIEGCDMQKRSNSPSALDVESGIAQEEDGQWKILTKAKVKFV